MDDAELAKQLLLGDSYENIAIVGSRSFDGYENLVIMDTFIRENIDVSSVKNVISGGAKGADTLGRLWAEANDKGMIEFKPDWDTLGKIAGMIRNESIIKNADVVFAFWDGHSKGTKSSIKLTKKYNKVLYLYTYEA